MQFTLHNMAWNATPTLRLVAKIDWWGLEDVMLGDTHAHSVSQTYAHARTHMLKRIHSADLVGTARCHA